MDLAPEASPNRQSPNQNTNGSPVRRPRSNLGSIPPDSVVINRDGRSLIAPNTSFARAVVMGNSSSSNETRGYTQRGDTHRTVNTRDDDVERQPASNLTILLNQREQEQEEERRQTYREPQSPSLTRQSVDEADSACGPTTRLYGSSAPIILEHQLADEPLFVAALPRQHSTGAVAVRPPAAIPNVYPTFRVRRCMSSKEMGTIAPPSGSPYAFLLHKKGELENVMRERLLAIRGSLPVNENPPVGFENSGESSTSSSRGRSRETPNEIRNRRRAEHAQAVVDDLCNIVADLFEAEAKLLNPTSYGVPQQPVPDQREQLVRSIENFVSALPLRYALGADTPSEVLLHMRLMAAVRTDKTKAVVHIHNLTDDSRWSNAVSVSHSKRDRCLRLVTISCFDATGLLEYISKLLATGGSRVLDADVMLTKDGIVLDRFVVEMKGRLRLDKLSSLIEAFLRDHALETDHGISAVEKSPSNSPTTPPEPSGPLYYQDSQREKTPLYNIQQEIEAGVPLTDVLASSNQSGLFQGPPLPQLRRMRSMPEQATSMPAVPSVRLSMRSDEPQSPVRDDIRTTPRNTGRQKRPLVNRKGTSTNLDNYGGEEGELDYVTIPSFDADGTGVENRVVPLIPFDEIMLIETLGTGRISTIYRAAWQHGNSRGMAAPTGVQMVALKVAMLNPITGDTSHVDELRREADIAARLNHPNICRLVGIAADAECFCLAYDYCEGGSLLSLLTDSSRYYEYLPIALDIANGMAYLHSRNVIHRDLKPSNVLLSKDHRAQIADFGMSVANTGQELTAETGTYRYMAPEVIRHESYSSNADVYSFGICLWQLITREIPFATMTPIQAAYAVAEGRRPQIPASTPRRLADIITACWDQDSHRRPSFTYIAMALADYAKMAFSPANVGAMTLSIANEMLATVEGNSTVNVDFTTPVSAGAPASYLDYPLAASQDGSQSSDVGLEIE